MASNPNPTLRYHKEDAAAQEVVLEKDDILIGRATECDIQLVDDQLVSRFHASLKIASDGYWLRDMDSTNGTRLDDKLIPPNQRTALRPGQNFTIGSYTFNLQLPETSAPIQAPPSAQHTMLAEGLAAPYRYDVEHLRKNEFAHVMDQANLNNAATSPVPLRTQKRMLEYLEKKVFNAYWHAVTGPVDSYTEFAVAAAGLINASPDEIAATEGCSTGLNYIAQSLEMKPGENVIFCDQEFPANVYPWMALRRDGVVLKMVPAVNGGLTLEGVQEAVDDRTRVVSVSAVQFLSGHRTDLAAIGRYCRERNIVFIVDAIQAIGHMPIDVRAMNIDVLVTGAHKSLMAGPGAGFLYVREGLSAAIEPRLLGSVSTKGWTTYLVYDPEPLEGARRFVLGTPNFACEQAMIASISLINELTREAIDRHTTRLAARALEVAADRGYGLYSTPHEHGAIVTIKSKWPYEEISPFVDKLEMEEGIFVSKQRDREGNALLRLSFHCYNTEEDILRVFSALDKKS
jgi:selenocysteine lyase/cysteine desulfurase